MAQSTKSRSQNTRQAVKRSTTRDRFGNVVQGSVVGANLGYSNAPKQFERPSTLEGDYRKNVRDQSAKFKAGQTANKNFQQYKLQQDKTSATYKLAQTKIAQSRGGNTPGVSRQSQAQSQFLADYKKKNKASGTQQFDRQKKDIENLQNKVNIFKRGKDPRSVQLLAGFTAKLNRAKKAQSDLRATGNIRDRFTTEQIKQQDKELTAKGLKAFQEKYVTGKTGAKRKKAFNSKTGKYEDIESFGTFGNRVTKRDAQGRPLKDKFGNTQTTINPATSGFLQKQGFAGEFSGGNVGELEMQLKTTERLLMQSDNDLAYQGGRAKHLTEQKILQDKISQAKAQEKSSIKETAQANFDRDFGSIKAIEGFQQQFSADDKVEHYRLSQEVAKENLPFAEQQKREAEVYNATIGSNTSKLGYFTERQNQQMRANAQLQRNTARGLFEARKGGASGEGLSMAGIQQADANLQLLKQQKNLRDVTSLRDEYEGKVNDQRRLARENFDKRELQIRANITETGRILPQDQKRLSALQRERVSTEKDFDRQFSSGLDQGIEAIYQDQQSSLEQQIESQERMKETLRDPKKAHQLSKDQEMLEGVSKLMEEEGISATAAEIKWKQQQKFDASGKDKKAIGEEFRTGLKEGLFDKTQAMNKAIDMNNGNIDEAEKLMEASGFDKKFIQDKLKTYRKETLGYSEEELQETEKQRTKGQRIDRVVNGDANELEIQETLNYLDVDDPKKAFQLRYKLSNPQSTPEEINLATKSQYGGSFKALGDSIKVEGYKENLERFRGDTNKAYRQTIADFKVKKAGIGSGGGKTYKGDPVSDAVLDLNPTLTVQNILDGGIYETDEDGDRIKVRNIKLNTTQQKYAIQQINIRKATQHNDSKETMEGLNYIEEEAERLPEEEQVGFMSYFNGFIDKYGADKIKIKEKEERVTFDDNYFQDI